MGRQAEFDQGLSFSRPEDADTPAPQAWRQPLPYPETLDSHNEYLKDRAARYD